VSCEFYERLAARPLARMLEKRGELFLEAASHWTCPSDSTTWVGTLSTLAAYWAASPYGAK